jgi:hypothetical protein
VDAAAVIDGAFTVVERSVHQFRKEHEALLMA